MPEISFLAKGTRFQVPLKRKTSLWLQAIAKSEHRTINSLTYVFATDSYVARLNKQYLRHDTLTDIITFDYSESDEVIGEIYISVPRVRENATLYKQSFGTELRRVMAHGLLHILGYADKTPRQKARMIRKEEACLSLWLSST